MIKNDLIRRSISTILVMFILQACQSSAETPVSTPTPKLVAPLTPQDQTSLTLPSDMSPTGKLILSDYNSGISEFNFSTMALVSRFHPPNNGFVGSTALSPDGKTFLMIY